MTHSKLSLLLAASGGLLAGLALAGTEQPFAGAKVQSLIRQELATEFTPDREVLVDVIEMPPHTTLERHWHPGEEFHYCLEGEVQLLVEGAEPVLETPGKASHVPFKALHTASTGEKGARVVVFRVHKKGEPMRYLESGGASTR